MPAADDSAARVAERAGGELSPAELGAWRGFLRVHAALVKELDAELAAEHELPLSSYEVLITLQAAPRHRCRMAELADSVLLSRSGMTRLVDRLEREGLLDRCSCDHDARGAYACLTSAGAKRLEEARATHLALVREQFISRFSAAELAAMAEMWARIAPCDPC